jgi:hypothetical protein
MVVGAVLSRYNLALVDRERCTGEVRMKGKRLMIVATFVTLAACQSSLSITTDTEADGIEDPVDDDVAIDVPSEPDGLDVPDDPDGPDVPDGPDGLDAPDVTDVPEDPPTEIGAPCEESGECDDGLFCNGTEYCHPTGVCRRTPTPDCDDGADCTVDWCDDALGCVNALDLTECNDHDPCTVDGCSAALNDCTHVPVDCDDGVNCSADLCDPLTGGCMHEFGDMACDDSDPCTVDTCNLAADACHNDLMDADGDGWAPASCGGDDCNDTDPMVHPSATDTCGDGVDQDCDGMDGLTGSCDCPVDITAPTTITGNTTGMPSVLDGSCVYYTGSNEVVHRLVLTTAMDLTFDTWGSGLWPAVYVLDGDCSGAELGCGDYYDGAFDLSLGPGTYYVIVDGYSGSYAGAFTLDISETVPVTVIPVTGNNTCAAAFEITADGAYGGSNATSGNSDRGTCGGSSGSGNDVWFTFTLTAASYVVLDTSGSTYDTVLSIRAGTCDGTELGCDDDSGDGLTGMLAMNLTAGTYYVLVDAWGSSSTYMGNYILDVDGII